MLSRMSDSAVCASALRGAFLQAGTYGTARNRHTAHQHKGHRHNTPVCAIESLAAKEGPLGPCKPPHMLAS